MTNGFVWVVGRTEGGEYGGLIVGYNSKQDKNENLRI